MIVIRVSQRTKPVPAQSNIHYTGASSSTSSTLDSQTSSSAQSFSSNEPASLYETSLQSTSTVGQAPAPSEVLPASIQSPMVVFEASPSELINSALTGSFT